MVPTGLRPSMQRPLQDLLSPEFPCNVLLRPFPISEATGSLLGLIALIGGQRFAFTHPTSLIIQDLTPKLFMTAIGYNRIVGGAGMPRLLGHNLQRFALIMQ